MNISYRKYLYKILTPSNKSRLLTTWNEETDPIEQFEAVHQVKFPLSTKDTDIVAEWHEITAKKAEKLYAMKNGKSETNEENTEVLDNTDTQIVENSEEVSEN